MTKPVTGSLTPRAALDRITGHLFARVSDVSAILGYDSQGRTVRKAIEAGEIPAVRVGATWRIPTDWVLGQLQRGSAAAASAPPNDATP